MTVLCAYLARKASASSTALAVPELIYDREASAHTTTVHEIASIIYDKLRFRHFHSAGAKEKFERDNRWTHVLSPSESGSMPQCSLPLFAPGAHGAYRGMRYPVARAGAKSTGNPILMLKKDIRENQVRYTPESKDAKPKTCHASRIKDTCHASQTKAGDRKHSFSARGITITRTRDPDLCSLSEENTLSDCALSRTCSHTHSGTTRRADGLRHVLRRRGRRGSWCGCRTCCVRRRRLWRRGRRTPSTPRLSTTLSLRSALSPAVRDSDSLLQTSRAPASGRCGVARPPVRVVLSRTHDTESDTTPRFPGTSRTEMVMAQVSVPSCERLHPDIQHKKPRFQYNLYYECGFSTICATNAPRDALGCPGLSQRNVLTGGPLQDGAGSCVGEGADGRRQGAPCPTPKLIAKKTASSTGCTGNVVDLAACVGHSKHGTHVLHGLGATRVEGWGREAEVMGTRSVNICASA
eukprot:3540442-Rhodomonas_salina.2